MINGPTVLILLGSIATIVLVAIVLVRQSQGFDTAAKTVRDELKAGREEAQQAAARQREELGASLKAGNDTLVRSLESLGTLGLIRFRGHVPKGGYDVHDAQDDEVPATTPAV